MPRRLFPATPSKLAAFADCPRRYRHAYVDRPTPPKGPPWAHNTVGSAVHAALRSWWELPRDRRTAASARQLLYGVWSDTGFRDAEQSGEWRSRAAGWLTDYVATLDPDDEPLGVERTVSTRTDGLVLSGRVDRLDLRDGELVVVDYKTGQRPPTSEDAAGSLALALYAVAAGRSLRRRCRRVELHHLPTGRVAAADHTDASLTGHLERAEAAAVEAADAAEALSAGRDADVLFPPRTSPGCAWCDHLRACPAGLAAAGPPRRPWDGLPGEAT